MLKDEEIIKLLTEIKNIIQSILIVVFLLIISLIILIIEALNIF